ncbi:MAG: thioredoxin family protein [Candidatus Aenigmarchaeota archaeon]|nr:thioredoxin family protein [Candidatus Aenigmarchaeota archaeon]
MNKFNVIYFFSNNSGACKIQNELMSNLEKNFKEVNFKRIDVDADNATKIKYQISETPSIVLENDGKVKEKFSGLTQELFLRRAIEKNLNGK